MARIYKRGGVWYSDIYSNGKRTRKKLDPNRKVAEMKFAEMMKSAHDNKYGSGFRDISWQEFKARFLEFSRGNKAADTVRRDLASITALEKFFKPHRLTDVTPELIQRWQGARKVKDIGPATINRDITSIKAMMRLAESWKYISPQNWLSIKRLRQARGRLLFYTPAQLSELLSQCVGIWKTIALLGSRAGLRRSEIYYLAWDDVDLSQGRIHVCPKAGWQPKDKEDRFIPVPVDLVSHLRATKMAQEGVWVLGRARPTLASMSVYFRRTLRKAGLSGSLHTLRHTYASHLAQAGVPLFTISKLLGHSDVSMTAIYSHLSTDSLGDAVAKLPPI